MTLVQCALKRCVRNIKGYCDRDCVTIEDVRGDAPLNFSAYMKDGRWYTIVSIVCEEYFEEPEFNDLSSNSPMYDDENEDSEDDFFDK